MGNWKIVVPTAAENRVLNPSAEALNNFLQVGGATVTRSDEQSAYGNLSYKIVPGGTGRGVRLQLSANTTHSHVLLAAYGVTGTLSAYVHSGATTPAVLQPIQPLGNGWTLYATAVAYTGDGTARLFILNSANETWYLDGVMCLDTTAGAVTPLHTYVDGDQPGCRWQFTPHASASERPVTTRAGGVVYDFQDDFGFYIESISGDMARPLNVVTQRPFIQGGSVDMTRINTRVLILVGWLINFCVVPLHTEHTALVDVLRPDAVPPQQDGRPQPVALQYWGAERILQLRGVYGGGLEEHQDASGGYNLKIPLAFDVAEPYWQEVIERAVEIDTEETATARMIFGRLDEAWDVLGPPASATPGPVYDIVETPDYVYAAGNFIIKGAINNLARYDKATGTWGAFGEPDDHTLALQILPNGDIYAAGNFANIGGVAISRVALYSGGVWNDLAYPGPGFSIFTGAPTHPLALDISGNLYVGAGVQLWRYDGTNWTQLGVDLDAAIRAVALSPQGNVDDGRLQVYVAGNFTERLLRINPAATVPAWETFLTTAPNVIYDAVMTPAGRLYLGIADTGLGWYAHGSSSNVLSFPAVQLEPSGLTFVPRSLAYDELLDELYITGYFNAPIGLEISNNSLIYAGAGDDWKPLPIDYTPFPDIVFFTVRTGLYDAFVGITGAPLPPPRPRNLWFGLGDTTLGLCTISLTYPSTATVVLANVPGGAQSKPVLFITADGDATINTLTNLTTGDEIVLNTAISTNDTIVIDLVRLRVFSQFNDAYGYLNPRNITPLPGSRFASWALLPSGNVIELRVNNAPTVTVSGVLRYVQRYHSYRAADVP